MMVKMKLTILVSIASLFLGGCSWKDSWEECSQTDHKDPVKGAFFSTILGSVTTDNGDECKIEEISRITFTCKEHSFDYTGYDDTLQCKYCLFESSPVARRLVCKSGAITMNTISFTPDKFHRELIH